MRVRNLSERMSALIALPPTLFLASKLKGNLDREKTLAVLSSLNCAGLVGYLVSRSAVLEASTRSVLIRSMVHVNPKHYLSNFAALYLVWGHACSIFSAEVALFVYLNGSCLSLAGLSSPTGITLGSSGGVAAIWSAVLWMKDFGPITAPNGAYGMLIMSGAFLLSPFLRGVDHQAHLVGAVFGVGYASLVHKLLFESETK